MYKFIITHLKRSPPASTTLTISALCRMGQLCLHMHPDQLQNSIMWLSVHIQNKGYDSKLYMIPSGAIFYRRLLDSSGNPLVRTTDVEGQLQELCDEVKTMITMGNENDAIDLLQPNYEAVEEQMDSGARGIGQAATLDVIALGYIAIGDLKMVGSLLDMVISFCNKYSTKMITNSLIMGKLEDSMLAYRWSLEILEREYDFIYLFIFLVHFVDIVLYGFILFLLLAASLAPPSSCPSILGWLYRCLLTILELSKGADSEDLVVPLLGLDNLLMKKGKAKDTENPFIGILNVCYVGRMMEELEWQCVLWPM
ncbi:hypothetical protein CsSME_00029397 [Camellia sinensis var. sinensis]